MVRGSRQAKHVIFHFDDGSFTELYLWGSIEINGDTLIDKGSSWEAKYSGWVRIDFLQ